jgi:rhodanese-related sulfurtransferase
MVLVVVVSQVWAAGMDISSRDAKALLDKDKNVFLLDVRTSQEYRQGRLSGAVLIPVGEIERRVQEVPKNKTIVVYCAAGSRSKSAADFLVQHGYRNVYNMTDGIVGWFRNGLPVQQ